MSARLHIRLIVLIAAAAIVLFCSGTARGVELINNGTFESPPGFTPAGTSHPWDGVADDLPDGWTRYENFSGSGTEDSQITPAADNGPSQPGSQCAHFERTNGGSSGDWTSLQQSLSIDASAYQSLMLTLNVGVFWHDLEAGGWSDPAFEWPAFVRITYNTTGGGTQTWMHGFYVDPPGDSVIGPGPDPGSGVFRYFEDTQVSVGAWTTRSLELLAELPDVAVITSIRIGGSGWSFESNIDNVSINGVPAAPNAHLVVAPSTGLSSSGYEGGPFWPFSKVYSLQNTGTLHQMAYSVARAEAWISLDGSDGPITGTLDPQSSVNVQVTIDVDADSLPYDSYSDVVTFTNDTNGSGNTSRNVALNILNPHRIVVSPAENLTSYGTVATGPYCPDDVRYMLRNASPSMTLSYEVTAGDPWISLNGTPGGVVSESLSPGASIPIDVLINDFALLFPSGLFQSVVTFQNLTNGEGDTSRAVNLYVQSDIVALWSAPGGGQWSDTARWTLSPSLPTYPNNTAAYAYFATIDSGAAVVLDQNVTLNELVLSASNLVLDGNAVETQHATGIQIVDSLVDGPGRLSGFVSVDGPGAAVGVGSGGSLTIDRASCIGGAVQSRSLLYTSDPNAILVLDATLATDGLIDLLGGQLFVNQDVTGYGGSFGTLFGTDADVTLQNGAHVTLDTLDLLGLGTLTIADAELSVLSPGGVTVDPDRAVIASKAWSLDCAELSNAGVMTADGNGALLVAGPIDVAGGELSLAGTWQVDCDSLANQGSVHGSGLGTIDVAGDLTTSAGSQFYLSADIPGPLSFYDTQVITLGGNWTHAATDPNDINVIGTRMVFAGAGPAPRSPSQYEIAGEDIGEYTAFQCLPLFVMGELYVQAGASVDLVDLVDNVPEHDEALYVLELTVESGGLLDLGGYNLYVAELTIDGTIVSNGGTLTRLIPMDCNYDGDVDGVDFLRFLNAFHGAVNPTDDEEVDYTCDGDVDLNDFEIFILYFMGTTQLGNTASGPITPVAAVQLDVLPNGPIVVELGDSVNYELQVLVTGGTPDGLTGFMTDVLTDTGQAQASLNNAPPFSGDSTWQGVVIGDDIAGVGSVKMPSAVPPGTGIGTPVVVATGTVTLPQAPGRYHVVTDAGGANVGVSGQSRPATLVHGPALEIIAFDHDMDLDGDGDADTGDFALFSQCFAGALNPPAPGCAPGVDADFDGDGDVDLSDYAAFAQNYTGSILP